MARPPSPPGVPLLGHSIKFTKNPLKALEEWSEEYGSVVELSFPGRTVVLVTEPELIRQVIEVDADSFSVGEAREEAFSGMEENAMVVSSGDDWKRMRNIMQRFFTPDAVDDYREVVLEETDRLIDEWEPGTVYDLYEQMSRLTIRVVSQALLGYDIKGDEEAVMRAADAVIEQSDVTNSLRMVPEWVPIPQSFRFRRARRDIRNLIHRIIGRKRKRNDDDLLSSLIEANDQGELSNEELRDNVCSFFLAGSDTSAATLTYTLFCLSNHPDIEDRLRTTVDSSGEGMDFDPADASQSDDLKHTLEEAMRLYPPAFSIGRKAVVDYELGGYEIPEGAQLILSQWVVHHDDTYFEDPYQFRPQRWRDGEELPKYAHFPFGGGDRFCIGSHFAMMEMPIILARLLQRVDFEVPTDSIDGLIPAATLRPENQIKFTVKNPPKKPEVPA